MRIVKSVALWALQVLLGALFVMIGVMKFRDPSWVRSFARWGYPDGFHLVIGALEALGGLALLVPALASYAALLLASIMAGAALTHLVHGEMQRFPVPLVYLFLIALVGWFRRRSALRRSQAGLAGAGVV
jgi:uncharacterized membrane protein YphA (DoxX/SURF4 family)